MLNAFPRVEDHIPAQNQAGNDLASVVTAFQSAIGSQTLTTSQANQLSSQALLIGQNFYDYTRRIGSDAAVRGGNEILSLAQQISRDILAAKTYAAPSTFVAGIPTQPTPYTAPAPSASSTVGDNYLPPAARAPSTNTPLDYAALASQASPGSTVNVEMPYLMPQGGDQPQSAGFEISPVMMIAGAALLLLLARR